MLLFMVSAQVHNTIFLISSLLGAFEIYVCSIYDVS